MDIATPDSIDSVAVSMTGVHKQYVRGNTTTAVLQGVNLDIPAGQLALLAGPSGSGKSTLLSILGCILTPDSGSVHILGRDVSTLSRRARTVMRRDNIGFVFQRFNLIRGLTALDNVCVPLVLRGLDQRQAQQRAMSLLNDVGLADRIATHPHRLSAGQCQRVALARALAGDPELILADEPTASLDGANGQEIMQLLRTLTKQHGKTAIVVTHDQRIFPMADRIYTMENGCLAPSGDAGDLLVGKSN